MALQAAAAPTLPGNLLTSVMEVGVACVEQTGSGDTAMVSSLVIEPTWLANIYDGQ